MTTAKVLRRVTLPPGDPALTRHARWPVIGVSMAYLASLAGVAEGTLGARASEHRKAVRAGVPPPSNAVDITDWWDLARWVLEHRLTTRLEADGTPPAEARRKAALTVSQWLAPIRELMR